MPKRLKSKRPLGINLPWFGYVRVSTEEQEKKGVSLEAQRAELIAWAELKGVTLLIYEDAGISAGSLQRPGLQEILRRLRAGDGAGLVVTKVDRFSRSLHDAVITLSELSRLQVQFAAIQQQFDTTTAVGKLMLNLVLSLAEWELETIRERTRDAIQHKAKTGAVYGKVPFGFDGADVDPATGRPRTLLPNAREQQVLAEMRAQRDAGMSFSAIARALTEAGVKPKYSRRGVWDHSSVRYILEGDRLADRVPVRKQR